MIDDGGELFGNYSRLPNGSLAANGFEVLKALDDNGDSRVDVQDAIWPRLILWRDVDHDGVSQLGELQPVTESRLSAIELRYHWTGRRDKDGNVFRYASLAELGSRMRSCYDVYFVRQP